MVIPSLYCYVLCGNNGVHSDSELYLGLVFVLGPLISPYSVILIFNVQGKVGHNSKTIPHIPEGVRQGWLPVTFLVFREYMLLEVSGPHTPAPACSPSMPM